VLLWKLGSGDVVMDRVSDFGRPVLTQERFLAKHRMVRLKLEWELRALSLDGANWNSERAESRAAAAAFRQCIADLTTVAGPALP
jgi:hypothetical protein